VAPVEKAAAEPPDAETIEVTVKQILAAEEDHPTLRAGRFIWLSC
jgi:hypothetical protein